MRSIRRPFGFFILLAVLLSTVAITGCAARVSTGYRVYDRDHNDHHTWDNNEVVFYGRWENETHRDHRDFRKRNDDEKKEYWAWRHGHQDNDAH